MIAILALIVCAVLVTCAIVLYTEMDLLRMEIAWLRKDIFNELLDRRRKEFPVQVKSNFPTKKKK